MLKGKPANLDTATENAKQIEYALNFQKQESEVNAVEIHDTSEKLDKLQGGLENMTEKLKKLEMTMQKGEPRTSTYRPRYGAGGTRFRQSHDQVRCYLCNDVIVF